MSKPYCTCKRAICICVGLIAGLSAYQECAVADDDGRPMIEAEAAPGTHSITGGSTMSFKLPTGYGEMVTDAEAKGARIADMWAISRTVRTDDADQSDLGAFWNLIKPRS